MSGSMEADGILLKVYTELSHVFSDSEWAGDPVIGQDLYIYTSSIIY